MECEMPLIKDVATKYDEGKPQWSLLPFDALKEVVQVYTKGARKYEPRNWEKGMQWSRIFDSTQRHLTSWYQDRETFDPEATDGTRLRQIAQATWGCLVLLAFELRRVGVDDRPGPVAAVPLDLTKMVYPLAGSTYIPNGDMPRGYCTDLACAHCGYLPCKTTEVCKLNKGPL